MAGTNKRKKGAYGEEVACVNLERSGLRIVERNWRRSGGEIDIVAVEGDVLVFVEVRTRTTCSFGSAEESIDWRKQRQVRNMAARYLQTSNRRYYSQYRFDVVAVYLARNTGDVQEVRHIRNAF